MELPLEYDIKKYIEFCKNVTKAAEDSDKAEFNKLIENSSPYEEAFLQMWEQIALMNEPLFKEISKAPIDFSEGVLRLMFDGWCLCKFKELGLSIEDIED